MEKVFTIHADFNNADAQGRIRLSTNGALNDIKQQNIKLQPGMVIQLDDNDEFSITAIVQFSEEEKIWVAKIDWNGLGK